MCYRHSTTKAFRNCICTIGNKRYNIAATCLQTLYWYWFSKSIPPIHGQTKIQLQLWVYKTSCRQHPVPTRYLYDGLEHIPPWFKPIHMICFFLLLQIAPHYTQTAYTYDLSITLIRSQAQGCLTTKNLYIWQAVWV